MAAARYNKDGSLDKSFNEDGLVSVPFNDITAEAKSVNIQNNSKIILAGVVYKPKVDADFALTRLLPDGTIDSIRN